MTEIFEEEGIIFPDETTVRDFIALLIEFMRIFVQIPISLLEMYRMFGIYIIHRWFLLKNFLIYY